MSLGGLCHECLLVEDNLRCKLPSRCFLNNTLENYSSDPLLGLLYFYPFSFCQYRSGLPSFYVSGIVFLSYEYTFGITGYTRFMALGLVLIGLLWLQDLKCFVFSLISLHFKIKPI